MSNPELALIDADLWTYDIAYAAQDKDGFALSFDYCIQAVEERLERILRATGCKEYEAYLTGPNNFRFQLATIKPYKGNRKSGKPFHYENIREYLRFRLGAQVIEGMEADDYLAVRQTQEGDRSCIVSRDKDLRQVPGWHYGYEVGRQKEFPLTWYDSLGELELDKHRKSPKISGGGLKFMYSQVITGDSTDNIPGLPWGGPVRAYETLQECKNEIEMQEFTLELFYQEFDNPDEAEEKFLENARLVWMTRELKNNKPVLYTPPSLTTGTKLESLALNPPVAELPEVVIKGLLK